MSDAGHVDQYIQPLPPLARRSHQPRDLLRLRDVALDRRRTLPQLGGQRVQRLTAPVAQHHPGAGAHEQSQRRLARSRRRRR